MDSLADQGAPGYQARFAERWGMLRNPHVRSLAWLIDSPGLLDPLSPEWAGKLAAPTLITVELVDALLRLDAEPAPLLAALGERPYTRLGLYAEKLMAFFYQSQGRLVAHGLQVRAARNDTVGEFDFLLDLPGQDGIEHIELATKFYLLQGEAASRLDTLIGPNLADSLGAKMRKIIGKQLALADHPAAQALLPCRVLAARALVKGWLFYPAARAAMPGIAAGHCTGFWCTIDGIAAHGDGPLAILPRLQWLAPYRLDADGVTFDGDGLAQAVAARFEQSRAPVLVALLRPAPDGAMVEHSRGFIVPDDWQTLAEARQRSQG